MRALILAVVVSLAAALPAAAESARFRDAGDGVVLNDLHYTPGATNPAVTQETIGRTICVTGWSATQRPTTSVTNPLKVSVMAAYHLLDNPANYEGDHLISIELGGCPSDAAHCNLRLNFWPQPWNKHSKIPGAHQKDVVENFLHKQVCAKKIGLEQAQRLIAEDWYKVFLHPGDVQ